MLAQAIEVYRATFQPSEWLEKPYVMMAAGVCAAETDEEAIFLRSSQLLAFARLRSGNPGKLPLPVTDINAHILAPVLAQVEQAMSVSAVGSKDTLQRQLRSIMEQYQPDELIVTGMIHSHDSRKRSFEIAADVLTELQSR
jgi:alkanesulfonate monooxygenase SsuD/methylene tetrahydromethanopterin reductase-like flavin-dependent oxidoreductase (luciferase family)